MNKLITSPIVTFSGLIAIVITSSAQAHHPMGGQLPSSVFEGLISGFAHPIIGLDHLLFVASIGLLAVLSGASLFRLMVAFTISSLSGLLLHINAIGLPGAELIVSVSVMLAGLVIIKQFSSQIAAGMFVAGAGLFHGFAYGEAIYGSPGSAMTAYFIGIGFVQCCIAAAVFKASKVLLAGSRVSAKNLRLSAGSGIALFGAFLLAGSI
ncbi:MAG: urease accessory protein [Oleiphilaceae bacterium]|jgi:urease accessory protein